MLILHELLLIVVLFPVFPVCCEGIEIESSFADKDKEGLAAWGYTDQLQPSSQTTVTEFRTKTLSLTTTETVTTTKWLNTTGQTSSICPTKTYTIHRPASTVYVKENNTHWNQSEPVPCIVAAHTETVKFDPALTNTTRLLDDFDTVVTLSSLSAGIAILVLVVILCASKTSQVKKNTRNLSKKN